MNPPLARQQGKKLNQAVPRFYYYLCILTYTGAHQVFFGNRPSFAAV